MRYVGIALRRRPTSAVGNETPGWRDMESQTTTALKRAGTTMSTVVHADAVSTKHGQNQAFHLTMNHWGARSHVLAWVNRDRGPERKKEPLSHPGVGTWAAWRILRDDWCTRNPPRRAVSNHGGNSQNDRPSALTANYVLLLRVCRADWCDESASSRSCGSGRVHTRHPRVVGYPAPPRRAYD